MSDINNLLSIDLFGQMWEVVVAEASDNKGFQVVEAYLVSNPKVKLLATKYTEGIVDDNAPFNLQIDDRVYTLENILNVSIRGAAASSYKDFKDRIADFI